MSGSSMDYLYMRIEYDLNFSLNTPERRAFKAHLSKVAAALKEIDRVEEDGAADTEESEAIRACLPEGSVLEEAIKNAETALQEMRAELDRVKKS